MEDDYDLVRPEVEEYVKSEILPRYEATKGHGVDHILNVIRRSLGFAKRINEGEIQTSAADFAGLPESLATGEINYDMAFTVAAFHDLGRERNNKLHHLVSAGMLLTDERLWELFDREQLRVMADAVMDHRASNGVEPVTIYGKIVSSADRDTDWKLIVRRAYDYNRSLWPEKTPDEAIEVIREKLWTKFGSPEAYATKKMYFENPEYKEMLGVFRKITGDAEEFRVIAREVLGEAVG